MTGYSGSFFFFLALLLTDGDGQHLAILILIDLVLCMTWLQNAHYLSVNVFSTKLLIGDTIFTSPTGDGTAIFRGHPSHGRTSRLQCKGSTFISQLF